MSEQYAENVRFQQEVAIVLNSLVERHFVYDVICAEMNFLGSKFRDIVRRAAQISALADMEEPMRSWIAPKRPREEELLAQARAKQALLLTVEPELFKIRNLLYKTYPSLPRPQHDPETLRELLDDMREINKKMVFF